MWLADWFHALPKPRAGRMEPLPEAPAAYMPAFFATLSIVTQRSARMSFISIALCLGRYSLDQIDACETCDSLPGLYVWRNSVDDSASLSKLGASTLVLGLNAWTRSARSASMITNTTYFGASPRLICGAGPGATSAAFATAASQPAASRSS